MLPKSAYSQAYVFRIALLSVSITTLAILLSGPVKRMSKKWSEKVWEKEFVVKRKLRNMDDTDGENGSAAIVGRDEAVPEGEAPLPALAPDVDMVD